MRCAIRGETFRCRLYSAPSLVITLYLLANVAYLCVLPLAKIQHAPDDRVGTAAMEVMFGGAGAGIMAVAIMVSTFGCCNGLILAGARVYYAMAQDGLFFKATARLNSKHVPATGSRDARNLDCGARAPTHAKR